MPAAVLLDLFNTLVRGGTDEEWSAVRRAMGVDLGVDPDVFSSQFVNLYHERSVGALGDLEATVRTIAELAGGRPTDSAVRLACARRVALTRQLLWPSGSTLAALDALHEAGWRLGLVSNCTAETPELWKRTPFAQRFEALAFSCELGVAKPDPAIYLAVCSFLRVAPAECLYVGDGADNELAGAARLGMTVVRTEEFVASPGSWPRERIRTLAELVSGRPGRSPRSAVGG